MTAYLLGIGYTLTCTLAIQDAVSKVQLEFSDYAMTLRLRGTLSNAGNFTCVVKDFVL